MESLYVFTFLYENYIYFECRKENLEVINGTLLASGNNFFKKFKICLPSKSLHYMATAYYFIFTNSFILYPQGSFFYSHNMPHSLILYFFGVFIIKVPSLTNWWISTHPLSVSSGFISSRVSIQSLYTSLSLPCNGHYRIGLRWFFVFLLQVSIGLRFLGKRTMFVHYYTSDSFNLPTSSPNTDTP